MLNLSEINIVLQQGGVIAYPTEAVFGLGCDPLNQVAVMKILQLKKRSVAKGLILIAADYQQLKPYIQELTPEKMRAVLKTWPGAITWVFPASSHAPKWITGAHNTVAVRVINHPIASQICQTWGSPIVSTSANLEGQPPALSAAEVGQIFADAIDLIVDAKLGFNTKPTQIRDAATNEILR